MNTKYTKANPLNYFVFKRFIIIYKLSVFQQKILWNLLNLYVAKKMKLYWNILIILGLIEYFVSC